MKNLKIIVLIGLMLIGTVSVTFADTKIGFVDLSILFDEYHKTKSYDKELESEHKAFEGIRNDKIEKIRESQGKLALLNEEKKGELEESIEKMKAELLEYDRQQKTTLTKERNEKIREILLEIEKVVSDYAEKEKFSVILNHKVLIYANQSFDVTEDILKLLNVDHMEK